MSFDTVIHYPTKSDVFPYQSYVGFFPVIPDNYNPNNHPIVPGISIKIDVGTAYAMNLIQFEEYKLETLTSKTAIDNEIPYINKHYNWHLCKNCLPWINFMQTFVIQIYAPDDLILNHTITKNNFEIFEHFNTLKENDNLENNVCSYGKCYAQQIIDYDFVGLNPQYRKQRQQISNQQIQLYSEYLKRIMAIRKNESHEEEYMKSSRQILNEMFIS